MVGHSPKTGSTESGDSPGASLDTVFDVLAHERRRHALAHLASEQDSVPVTELAQEVAVREAEPQTTEVSQQEFQTVAASLHHRHLPKLAEAGAVEYHPDTHLARTADTTIDAERLLSLARDGHVEK